MTKRQHAPLRKRAVPKSNAPHLWQKIVVDIEAKLGRHATKIAELRDLKQKIALNATLGKPGQRAELDDLNRRLVLALTEHEDLTVALQQAREKHQHSLDYVKAQAENERRAKLWEMGEQRIKAAAGIDTALAALADALHTYQSASMNQYRHFGSGDETRLNKLFSGTPLDLFVGRALRGTDVTAGQYNVKDPRAQGEGGLADYLRELFEHWLPKPKEMVAEDGDEGGGGSEPEPQDGPSQDDTPSVTIRRAPPPEEQPAAG